jgi:hypothetical protein
MSPSPVDFLSSLAKWLRLIIGLRVCSERDDFWLSVFVLQLEQLFDILLASVRMPKAQHGQLPTSLRQVGLQRR